MREKWGLYGLVIVTFILTASIAIKFPRPIGSDFSFHLTIAESWARGENGMFSELPMVINGVPYPPLFHWIMVPSVWLGIPYEFGRFLQMLMYPTALGLALWVMSKHLGDERAFYMGLFLVSSQSFFDYLLMPIPHALDVILFILTLNFYLEENDKWFMVSSILALWNHSVVTLVLFGGLFVHALFYERKIKEVFIIALASLPVMIPTAIWIHKASSIQMWVLNPQENHFWTYPVDFMTKFLGPLLISFPIFALSIYQWGTLQKLQKICILTVFSTLIMFPYWPARYLGYVALPLCILVGYKFQRNWILPLAPIIMLFFLVPWNLLLTNGFYVEGFFI